MSLLIHVLFVRLGKTKLPTCSFICNLLCHHFQDSGIASESPGARRQSWARASLSGEWLHCQDKSGGHSQPALWTVSSNIDPVLLIFDFFLLKYSYVISSYNCIVWNWSTDVYFRYTVCHRNSFLNVTCVFFFFHKEKHQVFRYACTCMKFKTKFEVFGTFLDAYLKDILSEPCCFWKS